MTKPSLVIIGDSAFAQIAYLYFKEEDKYKIVGFAVEREYIKSEKLFDLPIVPFEELPRIFPAKEHSIFAAITYGQLNGLRSRLVAAAKDLGYDLASYVSPLASVSIHARLGQHCFVFENNVIQPYSEIGDNVILWSGNHIGHHAQIGNHCFVSSHAVVSGFTSIGQHCFLGINCAISNNIIVGDDCWIGPSAVITKNVPSGTLIPPVESKPSKVTTYKYFKVQPTLADVEDRK